MKREFLISKFVCVKCGGLLELDYAPTPTLSQYAAGEPTGAAMVQTCIAVYPCQKCMAPLTEMRAAVQTLMGHNG